MTALRVEPGHWPIRGAFTIARGSRTEAHTLAVEITDGPHRGRGECVPYARYGETLDAVKTQLECLGPAIANGLDRAGLARSLPAGAARNAMDCALWDLEASRAGMRAWDLAGLPAPGPVTTVYTISLAEPDAMADAAGAAADRPILKLKLGGPGTLDVARVRAVRAAAPDCRLVADANEAWTVDDLIAHTPALADLGVEMIEQPVPAGADDALAGLACPVPLCADESCHDRRDLPRLLGRYQMVNIKLDKTGGLTEALALAEAARALGFKIMIGCMLATSLAMAPAVLVAQGADLVDLDGPLLLAADRDPALRYDGARVHPPDRGLWG